MKIRVDQDRCVGQGMCLLACPEMFELSDEDGPASALKDVVPDKYVEAIRQAERSCPERAIILSEQATSGRVSE